MPITSSGTEASALEIEKGGAGKETAVARAEDEIARKRAFVERFGAKNTKATQAQSRLKQIERIEVEELADSSRRAPHAALRPRAPERPRGAGAGRRQQVVRRQPRAGERLPDRPARRAGRHHRPERPRQVDARGIAVERSTPTRARVRWGHEARAGYFRAGPPRGADRQRGHAALRISRRRARARARPSCAASSGRVLFSGEEIGKKVRLLSGGECARLIFALLSVAKPNVLVLDEPTNHLDLETIHAVVEALEGVHRDGDLRVARSLVRLRSWPPGSSR